MRRKIDNESTYSDDRILDFFDNRIHLHTISDASDTFLYNAAFQYACLKHLPRICKENSIDIVHADVPHMSDVILRMIKSNRNTVTTVHTIIEGHKQGILASGLDFWDMDASERYTLALFPMLKLTQWLYLKRSPTIITVSNWMKGLLEQNYGLKEVSVIHNGVDHRLFSPEKRNNEVRGLDTDKPIVLFSSRMTVAKGAHYLIKAIPEIIKENREVHFVFSGAGAKEPWVNILEKEGVDRSYYSFLGYLDYSELAGLYARAEVFVVPSLYENLPIRVLEAMSSETAVVATNICAIPEAIIHNENGILIPPRDSNAIAESVTRLLQDRHSSEKLAKNARKIVLEKFSWERIGRET
ncbi:MAG: glycosyltransferase family 4 protein, partial [Candidatus Methanoperedens sp.]|nr:glycosyltransferase family 4 protein [Candidatus Methanoperedens sp.]